MARHPAIYVIPLKVKNRLNNIVPVEIEAASKDDLVLLQMACTALNTDEHIYYELADNHVRECRRRQADTVAGEKGSRYIAGVVAVKRTFRNITRE